jgi:hypothetical protein
MPYEARLVRPHTSTLLQGRAALLELSFLYFKTCGVVRSRRRIHLPRGDLCESRYVGWILLFIINSDIVLCWNVY